MKIVPPKKEIFLGRGMTRVITHIDEAAWGYEPGDLSGHDWFCGPGGPRFDRQSIPMRFEPTPHLHDPFYDMEYDSDKKLIIPRGRELETVHVEPKVEQSKRKFLGLFSFN